MVFTTPAITALRQHYPDADISYLVEEAAEPVVRHNPNLDRVLVVDRPRGMRRLIYDVGLARTLRRERFDLVIDFHGGPRSAWLTRATGARRRIGYARPGRAWAYTDHIPWTPALVPPRHSVDNQLDLLRPLGIPPPTAEAAAVEMVVDPGADAAIRTRLHAAGLSRNNTLIVLHVSAGNPFRRWPAAHFATTAARLVSADRHRRIIITSGPSDRQAAEGVAEAARSLAATSAAQILRCGEFDLTELRALLTHAALFIGGDSGPLHVAATTAVPVVALFGPTLPERSMPWRPSDLPAIAVDGGPLPCRPCHQRVCVPGDFRCLQRLGPERVLAAAEMLLRRETMTA